LEQILESNNPLMKRIKRHIIGRIRSFFAATAPGLEKLCFEELNHLPLMVKRMNAVPGGVEFNGYLKDCYLANLKLRSANRILMRISTFKATNFRQLEHRISDFPWELYLYPNTPLKVNVTTKTSRLYHGTAIKERVIHHIKKRLTHLGNSEKRFAIDLQMQQLFIRVENDRFMLSIDSSGERLYKRNIKKKSVAAPIRETLAAAVLMLSGYKPDEPLLDPMCGSGTFSLEGSMIAKNISAGYYRNFAFMQWPAFKERQWAFLKAKAGKDIIQMKQHRIFASDMDENACQNLERCIQQHGLSDIIRVSVKDFFDLLPEELTQKTGLIVMNPPYGCRIGTLQNSYQLFSAIIERLKNVYQGWKLALITPSHYPQKAIPFKLASHSLYHGGLNVKLLEGTIS